MEVDQRGNAHALVAQTAQESVLRKDFATATHAQVCCTIYQSVVDPMSVTVEVTWSNWGSWTSCTKSCGSGRSDRYRSCSGGSTCRGDRSEAKWCNTNTCPGQPVRPSRKPKIKSSDPLCQCPDALPPCWCHATGVVLFDTLCGLKNGY